MDNTQDIADAVGRSRMAEALSVGATAVSKAVVNGKFPPSWFFVMEALCVEKGIDCPRSLFGMKSTSSELTVAQRKNIQVQASDNVNASTSGGAQ